MSSPASTTTIAPEPFSAVVPAACAHIAEYYQQRWLGHKCIAFNMLRRGYKQWAAGRIEITGNNLFC